MISGHCFVNFAILSFPKFFQPWWLYWLHRIHSIIKLGWWKKERKKKSNIRTKKGRRWYKVQETDGNQTTSKGLGCGTLREGLRNVEFCFSQNDDTHRVFAGLSLVCDLDASLSRWLRATRSTSSPTHVPFLLSQIPSPLPLSDLVDHPTSSWTC